MALSAANHQCRFWRTYFGAVPNAASSQGGGIYNTGGTVSMTGTGVGVVGYNSAATGGGIYVGSGKLTLKQVPVDENKATTGNGGGIFITKGKVTASSACHITNNSAANGNGGGIFNSSGALTLNGVGVTNSIASNSAINGGGMYLAKASTTTFNGALVNQNKATGKGVGIAYENGAKMPGLPGGVDDKDDPGGKPVQV